MKTTDVVVIGGGVLGAAVSYHTAREGLRVTLVERGATNREGSGTTAGNLHIQAIHTQRPGQTTALDNQRLLDLQSRASALWNDVEHELDADVELRRSGGLMVAETESQVADLAEKHALERSAGLDTELLDAKAARQVLGLLGPTVLAAVWCPADGYANPLLVTPAYLRAAKRYDARIVTGSPVTALQRDRHTWIVRTRDEAISAPVVVNAAGPWIAHMAALAGIGLDMAPVAIQMHATARAPEGTLPVLVQHVHEGLSVKQVSAGNILIGGGWPAARLNFDGRSVPSTSSMRGNVAQAIRLIPSLSRHRLIRMWAGPLAATRDEMPLIGEHQTAPGMYVVGGTYAFTFAPLWGRILTDLIFRRPPCTPISDLGPARLTRSVMSAADLATAAARRQSVQHAAAGRSSITTNSLATRTH